ncbi:MAG: helix-turn-helix transcriptional regulator [Fimbriimonadaceae bacterium]
MSTHELSAKEAEIVELAIHGFTNERIAHQLGLAVETVNTYWLRMKVGGAGRTDAVAKVIRERAEKALRDGNLDREELADHIADRQRSLLEVHAALALLHLAMDQVKSAVWATDKDLALYLVANGELPSVHFGESWETGKTVYDVFKTKDPEFPPVAAHLEALNGKESSVRLKGELSKIVLRAIPLRDVESHEVIGTIGIMNYVGE